MKLGQYTIKSARWSNLDHTAILLDTEEAGWILKCADMNADEWGDIQALPNVGEFTPKKRVAARDALTELDALKVDLRARGIEV